MSTKNQNLTPEANTKTKCLGEIRVQMLNGTDNMWQERANALYECHKAFTECRKDTSTKAKYLGVAVDDCIFGAWTSRAIRLTTALIQSLATSSDFQSYTFSADMFLEKLDLKELEKIGWIDQPETKELQEYFLVLPLYDKDKYLAGEAQSEKTIELHNFIVLEIKRAVDWLKEQGKPINNLSAKQMIEAILDSQQTTQ